MNAHDEPHWPEFSSIFRDREGFDPNPQDSRVKELFFWFNCGGTYCSQREQWRDDIGDPGVHDRDPATLNPEHGDE